jgi:hypothetical protein
MKTSTSSIRGVYEGQTGAPCVKVPGSLRVPLPPREQLCNRSCSNKQQQTERYKYVLQTERSTTDAVNKVLQTERSK